MVSLECAQKFNVQVHVLHCCLLHMYLYNIMMFHSGQQQLYSVHTCMHVLLCKDGKDCENSELNQLHIHEHAWPFAPFCHICQYCVWHNLFIVLFFSSGRRSPYLSYSRMCMNQRQNCTILWWHRFMNMGVLLLKQDCRYTYVMFIHL